jgi:lysosomal acid lipase/cholesteryl ester hydrolase
VATEIPHYEHLDFLWARDIEILVFPHVFNALESFTNGGHTKENYEKYKVARTVPMSTCILPPAYDCEDEGSTIGSFAFAPIEPPRQGFDTAVISRAQDGPCDRECTRPPLLHEQAKAEMQQIEEYRASSSSTPDRGNSHTVRASEPPDCDEEAPPSSAEYRLRNKRNASIGSFEAPSLLKRGGIRLGVGKAANSVVSRGVEELGPNSRNNSDTDTALERNGGGMTGEVRRTRDSLTSC